ncbi:MAG: ribonuclease HI [Planctomycetes bacterium]|nr:ribonuclease HI [Planctomycetota bacterium]
MKRGNKKVLIYTDGGCRGNPGLGAWAAVLVSGALRKEISGVEPHTTNNRMELTAAIRALEQLKRPCQVILTTDSQYLRRGITEWLPRWVERGWRTASKKPVLNRDLWERILELTRRHQMEWRWVEGHSGDRENERCDRLVNEAMDRHTDGLGGSPVGR